jgi:hypothetical protein
MTLRRSLLKVCVIVAFLVPGVIPASPAAATLIPGDESSISVTVQAATLVAGGAAVDVEFTYVCFIDPISDVSPVPARMRQQVGQNLAEGADFRDTMLSCTGQPETASARMWALSDRPFRPGAAELTLGLFGLCEGPDCNETSVVATAPMRIRSGRPHAESGLLSASLLDHGSAVTLTFAVTCPIGATTAFFVAQFAQRVGNRIVNGTSVGEAAECTGQTQRITATIDVYDPPGGEVTPRFKKGFAVARFFLSQDQEPAFLYVVRIK